MDQQLINNDDNEQGEYFYVEYRFKNTPMSVFQKPIAHRIYAYLCVCLIAIGAAMLVIRSITDNQQSKDRYFAAGMFLLGAGVILGGLATDACIEVRSFAYIVAPCLLSEERLDEIYESAHERTPIIKFVPYAVVI
ncbi:Hypothetical_protein [Hexamita inflata]|uniref:Hypothetical_protein n=1 Tax=Hexamita inflata TaxID=28002 RepID=A0AA86NXZ1_9EUKA|nr:Hypothetical protein HINF_LOCUS15038 [Hexamita inflata]